MSQPSPRGLEHILDPLDENTIQALKATGANLRDVTEAEALADRKSDLAGLGEQIIPGPVKQALVILSGDQR